MTDPTLDPVLVDLVARTLDEHPVIAGADGLWRWTWTCRSCVETAAGPPHASYEEARAASRGHVAAAVLTALSAAGWGDVREENDQRKAAEARRDDLLRRLNETRDYLKRVADAMLSVDELVIVPLHARLAAYARLEEAARAALKRLSTVLAAQTQLHVPYTTMPELSPYSHYFKPILDTLADALPPAPTKPVEDPPAGTPDLMAALRGSIDRAKAARKPVEEGDRG